jgi:outer membrane protein
MNTQMTYATAMLVALMTLGSARVEATEGDWLFRVGAHQIDPKSNNHPVVRVDSGTSLTLSATYFLTHNVAFELLGAAPSNHDIRLVDGGTRVGKTRHLPPTFSVQWHFAPEAQTFKPYVGAGLNYTAFFDEKTSGPLAGSKLELDSSLGLSAELGMDVALTDDWAVNFNVRWFDIDSDAKLDGADLGTVEIDPYAYGVMFTRKVRY